ncbi:hypothetical protein [Desulfonema magnum]|uniref:Uncharacterized protein n=1 Tax=Desulfonema magnum TaxID=45655 RepID=A0A975GRL8_9BACT|nr:hypothetical protein [Desulfonema magnum]QTA90133.1 Uncharacterized protein dnm_061940 [Desulfonema magnum]
MMVIKDESDRILISHKTAWENGDGARQILEKVKKCGMAVTRAFSEALRQTEKKAETGDEMQEDKGEFEKIPERAVV